MRCSLLAAAALVLVGCDPPAGGAAGSASASAAPPPPPPTAAPAPLPPPADLDVAPMQKALKCATDAKSGPCGVLAKMTKCTPWDPIVPSGDGRWLGRGVVVEGSKTTEQVVMLRARRAALSEVGQGQLAVRISLVELPKQEGAAFDQADRALRAFERGDVPQRTSPTMEYVKQRTAWPEVFAARTAGGQVFADTPGGMFLCQGASRTVLAVERAGKAGSDGTYAELWPVSW